MSLPPRILLALLFLLAIQRSVMAEPAALFVGGSVSAADRDDLRGVARDVVQAAGWSVSVPDLADADLAVVIKCARGATASACMPAHLEPFDVDRAIVLAVDREGRKGAKVRAAGWVFRRSGEQIAVDQRHCEPCDEAGLRDAIKELTGVLMRDARAAVAPSMVIVRSSPDQARVSIDGEFVGLTDLEHKVYAGPHTIQIEKEGYRTEIRDVVVGDGERAPIEVTLTPSDERPIVTPRPSRLPWLAIGVGAVLAVGGGVLIALDEDATGDDGSALRQYRDSAAIGVVSLGVGAAVATVGVVWLLRSRRTGSAETHDSSRLAPVLEARSDGAVVGIGGRF